MSDLKIFTENIEPEALNQIYTLVKQNPSSLTARFVSCPMSTQEPGV